MMAYLRLYLAFFLINIIPAISGIRLAQQDFLHDDSTLSVTFDSFGTTYEDLNQTILEVLQQCGVRHFLNSTRYRVISSELLAPLNDAKLSDERFRSTVYDYTNSRSVFVDGRLFDPSSITLSDANTQPVPNEDEVNEAAEIAQRHTDEMVGLSMPPVLSEDFPNGTSHRIIKLALTSNNTSRIVYVNMNNGTFMNQATADMNTLACSAPRRAASGSRDRRPGTLNLQITQGGNVLWTFQAVRPSASSGTKGSGIELKNVKYKGKTVLFQAHVPILNVEYEAQNTGCGPHYRDWQDEELPFQCSGRDFADGFRLCSSPAKTILDSHVDGGNYRGVGIYVQGSEVVLVSQLEAGWYRYITEWRFHVDGTLRPRFGFGAILEANACVCQVHHHNVYWRLDFDVVTAGNNIVREFNKPPIIGSSNFHDKTYEIHRSRDASHARHWEVSNVRTGDTYGLFPGSNDGIADAFGAGDLWVLRYHSNELDDGVTAVGGTAEQTKAQISRFMNGESVKNQDIVLWYAAHFKHDQNHDVMSHIVGPELRPLRW